MFKWIKSWFRKPEPEKKVYKIEISDGSHKFTIPPDCHSVAIEYIGAGGEKDTMIYSGGGGGGGGIAISGGGHVAARGGRGGSYGQPGEPGEFKTNMTPGQLHEFLKKFKDGLL